jgi:MFS superfamily sulfate permease-like transporter
MKKCSLLDQSAWKGGANVSQNGESYTMSAMIFWLRLPFRAFLHFWRFVFGHPVAFIAVFAVFVVLFSYMSTIQIMPDVQAIPGGNTQRTVMMFPAAGAWAALSAMVCGCLMMWIGEHFNKPITTWTKAPSIWTRPAVETAA